MFDLFRRRDTAVRYLLGGLLMVVAISMVVTLIPGYGSGDSSRQDQVIVDVAGDPVSVREVQLRLQTWMKNQSLPPGTAPILIPQFIDQIISQRALAYEAQRLGFRITENDVAEAIRSQIPQLFPEGKFVGREAYAAMLAQRNLTIADFENDVRKQLLLSQLQNLVAEGNLVLPSEIETEFRRNQEKVKVEYVVLSPEKLRADIKVSDDEVKAHFMQRRATYNLPEQRSVDMLIVDEARTAASFEISDAELRRLYEDNKDRFRSGESVKARHILLKTTEKPEKEVAAIQAKADALLKQVKGGADFADLARKNSEDTVSAANGGDLGFITRDQTVKSFETAAFALKPNEISGVIKTEYGFHIIQVLERREAKLRSFDEVKPELATENKKQMVFDRMQRLADEMRAELAKNPASAEQIAKRTGAQFVRVAKTRGSDPLPEVGAGEVASTIAGMAKGEVTPVLQASANKLVIATVTDVIPPRPAELADVAAGVRNELVDAKLAEKTKLRVKELEDKTKSAGGDLKRLAKEMGLEYKTPPEFARDGAVEGLGSAGAVAEAFERPVGALVGPVFLDQKHFVVKVLEKIPADMSKLPAERESLLVKLKGRKARERNELFEDGLVARLIKEGKIKRNDDAIKRLIAGYSS